MFREDLERFFAFVDRVLAEARLEEVAQERMHAKRGTVALEQAETHSLIQELVGGLYSVRRRARSRVGAETNASRQSSIRAFGEALLKTSSARKS